MLVHRRLSVFCQLRPYRLKKNGGLAFRVMANGAKAQTLQPTRVTPKHRRHCLRNRISFHWKTNYNQLAVKMNQSEDVLIRCWLENHWLCLWKCPPCKSINCIHWFCGTSSSLASAVLCSVWTLPEALSEHNWCRDRTQTSRHAAGSLTTIGVQFWGGLQSFGCCQLSDGYRSLI